MKASLLDAEVNFTVESSQPSTDVSSNEIYRAEMNNPRIGRVQWSRFLTRKFGR